MFSFADLIAALNDRFGAWSGRMTANANRECRFPLQIKLGRDGLRCEVLAPYGSRIAVVVDDRHPGSGGERLNLCCVESFNLGDMPYFLDRIWVRRDQSAPDAADLFEVSGLPGVVAAVARLLNEGVDDPADRV